MYDKKALHKGFKGVDETDGDEEFLAVDRDPWTASASKHGRNAKFDDDAGTHNYAGHGVDGATDNEAFLRASTDRTHESDAEIYERFDLIDGQVDQPAGPMLGGGGPVSENVRRTDRDGDWSGSGRKGPRYKNPLGAQGQGNMRKPR